MQETKYPYDGSGTGDSGTFNTGAPPPEENPLVHSKAKQDSGAFIVDQAPEAPPPSSPYQLSGGQDQVDAFQVAAATDPENTAREVAKAKVKDAVQANNASGYVSPDTFAAANATAPSAPSPAEGGSFGGGGRVSTSTMVGGGQRVEGVLGGRGQAAALDAEWRRAQDAIIQTNSQIFQSEQRSAEARNEIELQDALLKSEKNRRDAVTMQKFADGNMRIQQEMENEVGVLRRRVGTMIDHFSKMKVNTDFFRDKSAGQQIAAAIAITMGSYASAMGAGPNVALKLIDDAIQRDLDLQQQEIMNKKGAIDLVNNRMAQAMKQGMDMLSARSVVEAATLKASQSMLDAAMANNRVKLNPQYVMETANTLQAKALTRQAAIETNLAGQVAQRYQVKAQLLNMDTQTELAQTKALLAAQTAAGKNAGKFTTSFGSMGMVKNSRGEWIPKRLDISDAEISNAEKAWANGLTSKSALDALENFRRSISEAVKIDKEGKERIDWSTYQSEYEQLKAELKNVIMPGGGTFDAALQEIYGKVLPGSLSDYWTSWNDQTWRNIHKTLSRRVLNETMAGTQIFSDYHQPAQMWIKAMKKDAGIE